MDIENMSIEKATERCNQLIKPEHASWIGISNQVAMIRVLNELEKIDKRISDLEIALMDMVLQFADENKDSINTMGLSALEIAFDELDFDNPMPIKEVHKRYKKLAQEYYKVEREGK